MAWTLAIVVLSTVALVFVIGFGILWSQHRVPTQKAIVAELTIDPAVKAAWRKGKGSWRRDDAAILCGRLRSHVTAGTEEHRERLCRSILEQVARRSGMEADWTNFAESAERVAAMADEAGHWRIAEHGWKRAAKAARGESVVADRAAKAKAAGSKASELEFRDQADYPV